MSLSVLYGCDEAYAPYTGVSMTTLFENNRDVEEITVYLAAMGFSQESLGRFARLAEEYGRTLVVLDTERAVKQISELNCGAWNGSLAAWLRFFVLDQIPETVDRLVWLDSDTIIGSGVAGILDTALDDAPVAAVCDCLSYYERFRLGIRAEEPYYNSGVIVFNLDYWRRHTVSREMIRCLETNVEKYLTPDQDMMNDFFRGQICRLPPQYNVQSVLMAYDLNDYFSVYRWHPDAYYTPEQIRQALDRPAVLHFFRFLGDYPWTNGKNYHPARERYEEWKRRSLWREHPGAPARRELLFRAEKLLFRLLPRGLFLRVFAWYTNRRLPKRAGSCDTQAGCAP